jgi:hypothetical protein
LSDRAAAFGKLESARLYIELLNMIRRALAGTLYRRATNIRDIHLERLDKQREQAQYHSRKTENKETRAT